MAILWLLEWDGFTKEQYEELSRRVDWVANPPDGLLSQVTAFGDSSLVLTQVWQSPNHVMEYMEKRLLPAINEMGIRSMPKVDQYVVHETFPSNK